MKHLVDIHVVLSTPQDFDVWEEQAEEASDKFNTILHMLYDGADEDIAVERLEKMIQHVWENWLEDRHLLDIEDEELRDWVDQLIATWDDANL